MVFRMLRCQDLWSSTKRWKKGQHEKRWCQECMPREIVRILWKIIESKNLIMIESFKNMLIKYLENILN